ncbi:hypothetical protein SAMN02982917_0564 [Azospirillum oryzae]|uniref:Uncharacterized protein n=1 Tax=Azospirillum oryzae TaxID=286727 RepID=A0A1X7HSZ5_9PROT|nr:hypothetical protein [Azospirillum oryzae]SMF92330.1 hypothetical protein SAMN02982917_0564 [Azospirillum oryzae]
MAVAIPLITALTPLISDLIDRIPDPDAKAAAEANAKLVGMLQAGDTAQLQVNAAEAANPSLFVSGWPAGCRLGLRWWAVRPDRRLSANGLGTVDLVTRYAHAADQHRHAHELAGADAGPGSLPDL